MMEERDLGQESGRVVAGILGLFLVGAMVLSRFAISPILTFLKKWECVGMGCTERFTLTPHNSRLISHTHIL